MSLYAWLMLASIVGPLALSFDQKVAFYKYWKGLFIGIAINALLFIFWDSWFVKQGVWGFNQDYVWNTRWARLPIEEWSFFVVVPYASVFIYACLRAYFPSLKQNAPKINYWNYVVIAVLLIALPFFTDRLYTVVNFIIAILLLSYLTFKEKPVWMKSFWIAYCIHLIPFILINGVLTGAVTSSPVVWYSAEEIIGTRFITIPIEDFVYALTGLLLPIYIMERLK
ncbi:MAG: lycopene cyclase domain-containing protein [Chitinophagales bacterium]|nr:lycopene cyclase domain-containing protein [Chitinophagales bacterium]